MKISRYCIVDENAVEFEAAEFECCNKLPADSDVKHLIFAQTCCVCGGGSMIVVLSEVMFMATTGLPFWGACFLAAVWAWISWSGYHEVRYQKLLEANNALEVLIVSTPIRAVVFAVLAASLTLCFWVAHEASKVQA